MGVRGHKGKFAIPLAPLINNQISMHNFLTVHKGYDNIIYINFVEVANGGFKVVLNKR